MLIPIRTIGIARIRIKSKFFFICKKFNGCAVKKQKKGTNQVN